MLNCLNINTNKNNDEHDNDILQKILINHQGFKSLALLDTKYLHEFCCEIIAFLYLLHGASYAICSTLTELYV